MQKGKCFGILQLRFQVHSSSLEDRCLCGNHSVQPFWNPSSCAWKDFLLSYLSLGEAMQGKCLWQFSLEANGILWHPMALTWNSLPFLRSQSYRRWALSEATLSARSGCGQALNATQDFLYGSNSYWVLLLVGHWTHTEMPEDSSKPRPSRADKACAARGEDLGRPLPSLGAIAGPSSGKNRAPGKYLAGACACHHTRFLAPYLKLYPDCCISYLICMNHSCFTCADRVDGAFGIKKKLTCPTCDFVFMI